MWCNNIISIFTVKYWNYTWTEWTRGPIRNPSDGYIVKLDKELTSPSWSHFISQFFVSFDVITQLLPWWADSQESSHSHFLIKRDSCVITSDHVLVWRCTRDIADSVDMHEGGFQHRGVFNIVGSPWAVKSLYRWTVPEWMTLISIFQHLCWYTC